MMATKCPSVGSREFQTWLPSLSSLQALLALLCRRELGQGIHV